MEIDPFCRAVLAKHWPDVRRYEDVRTVGSELERVDVLCGGFPCQDISLAGFGGGLDAERSGLWSEFDRLVGELRPRYVVVENSTGLTARGLGRILGDLAGRGLDAEWSRLSACAMGAPHMRQRLLIVAHANGLECSLRLRRVFERAGTLQVLNDFESARTGWQARMADASALYGGALGLPDRMDRCHGIGNSIVPQIAEWIARRILDAETTP